MTLIPPQSFFQHKYPKGISGEVLKSLFLEERGAYLLVGRNGTSNSLKTRILKTKNFLSFLIPIKILKPSIITYLPLKISSHNVLCSEFYPYLLLQFPEQNKYSPHLSIFICILYTYDAYVHKKEMSNLNMKLLYDNLLFEDNCKFIYQLNVF